MPLTIKPPRQPSTIDADFFAASQAVSGQTSRSPSRSASPVQPSASPLTPTARHAAAFPAKHKVIGDSDAFLASRPARDATIISGRELIDRPAPRPFSGDDATDAIALRAAISSLQFQRKKAAQDIKTLQTVRNDALARPDDFQAHVIKVARQQAKPPKDFDFSFKSDADDLMEDSDGDEKKSRVESKPDPSTFASIPLPQDVVRCPPVNWDKYHIVGEPLDRMHNVHKRTADNQLGIGRKESVLAAPYDPALDRLDGRSRDGNLASEARRDSVSFSHQHSDFRRMSKVSGH